MDKEENREHLEMIRKALELIEDRVFSMVENQEAHGERIPQGFINQFLEAHEYLTDMVTHLADLAGIKEEEGND